MGNNHGAAALNQNDLE